MKKSKIDEAMTRAAIAYAAANKTPRFQLDWDQAIEWACSQLPSQLETSKTKTVEVPKTIVEDGIEKTLIEKREVPVMAEYDPFSERNKLKMRERLEIAYIEKPVPKLDYGSKPDLRRFLSALKYLFPNVKDVKQAFTSALRFLQSLNNKHSQCCLYLYSSKSGGTGKTFFAQHLKELVSEKGGIAKSVTDLKDSFLDPKAFQANFTVLEDLNPNLIAVETLNNLIDKVEMSYNIKFGPKGTFANQSDIVITSNYCPNNVNSRRWCVIEYLPFNMQFQEYDREKYMQAVDDMLTCFPQDKSLVYRFREQRKPNANDEMLMYIKEHAHEGKSRPTAFFLGHEKMVCQFENFFVDLQSLGFLKVSKTPVRQRVLNWSKLLDVLVKHGYYPEDGSDDADDLEWDPLAECAAEWDALIEQLCGPKPAPQDDGPKPRGVSSFKDFIDASLTHFSSASTVASTLEAQYCANCVKSDGSKVDLHTTKEECRPVVMAFESDTLPLAEQEQNIKSRAWDAKVFSGSKSLHVLVRIPPEVSVKLDTIVSCDKYAVYHRLYKHVADRLFTDTSVLDMQCKSWLRKFRTPDGVRDTGVIQTAEFNPKPEALPWDAMLEYSVECQRLSEQDYSRLRERGIKRRDVSKHPKVVHYLETPFQKMTGNGDSDSSLYRAICTCIAADDQKTLLEVYEKAKSEKWTISQLDAKTRSAKRFLEKRS